MGSGRSQLVRIGLVVLVYASVCAYQLSPHEALSHTAIFGLCYWGLLSVEGQDSLIKALRSIHSRSNRLYFVLPLTLVVPAFAIYSGVGVVRAALMSLLALVFFLVFSGLGDFMPRKR
jgi:hypothetical protein